MKIYVDALADTASIIRSNPMIRGGWLNNGVLILCQQAELVIFQTEAIASLRAFFLPLSHTVTTRASLILDNQSFVNFASAC